MITRKGVRGARVKIGVKLRSGRLSAWKRKTGESFSDTDPNTGAATGHRYDRQVSPGAERACVSFRMYLFKLVAGVRPESAPIGTGYPLAGPENGANPGIPENPDRFATVLFMKIHVDMCGHGR